MLDNLEKGVESPRGGRNNVLVDDEVGQCLQDIINEKCVLTLSQINGELKRRLPTKRLIHDRTVARNLERMLFRVKLVRPVLAGRTDMMFCKKGKKMETGSSIMQLCATMFLSMSVRPARMGRGWDVFHSAYMGGMNAPRLSDFAA